jgi:anti-sigma B factor antagonist
VAEPRIRVEQQQGPGEISIRVWGDLDLDTVPELRRVFDALPLEPAMDLRVDLRQVGFLSAAGLGLLAGTASRLAAKKCRVLVRATARDARLFRLVGLGHLLEPDES